MEPSRCPYYMHFKTIKFHHQRMLFHFMYHRVPYNRIFPLPPPSFVILLLRFYFSTWYNCLIHCVQTPLCFQWGQIIWWIKGTNWGINSSKSAYDSLYVTQIFYISSSFLSFSHRLNESRAVCVRALLTLQGMKLKNSAGMTKYCIMVFETMEPKFHIALNSISL